MAVINPTISIIIYNVNGINACRDCQSGFKNIMAKRYIICKKSTLSTKMCIDYK